MKKYLSLILVFAFMLSMIPMSVSADVTTAELKSVTVTGATLIPSLTSGEYTYDVIVDDKNAALPQLNYALNDNTASYDVLKSAKYLGDYTLVKVTHEQTEKTYKFTFRAPYESDSAEISLIAKDSTDVRASSSEKGKPSEDKGYHIARIRPGTQYTYYVLVKFDFTDKNPNPFGTFTFSYYLRSKDLQGAVVQIAGLKNEVDWTQQTATWENTFGTNKTMELDTSHVINYTVGSNSTGIHTCDISSLVKSKLLNGAEKFTLVFSLPESNCTTLNKTDVQWHMYSINAEKDNYKPTIKFNKTKINKLATLKSVEIKNALVLDEFSETKEVYNIGVKEGDEPSFEYILNDSHANAVVTTEDNVTTITVTAQDGVTTKVYTFNHKTYKEMGVSETKEVEIKNATLTYNNTIVDLNVTFNNLNVNKKKLTFVTLTKKDGVLVGSLVNSVTKEYATGSYNDEYITSVTLPTDMSGVSVEAYIYDTTDANNKKVVYKKVSYPTEPSHTPTITDTDKAIDLKADADKPGNVIVYGKGEPNQYVTFFVAHPNKTLSQFTVEELKAYAAVIDMAKANSDGIWEKSVTFPDEAGNYVAYLNAETYSDAFLHASSEQKKSKIKTVYEEIYKDQEKETAVANIKTQLGIKDDENITDLILGIDTSCFDILKEEDVIDALYSLTKEEYNEEPEELTDEDVIKFVETFNKAVIIAKLNNGTAISVSDLNSTFAFSDFESLKTLLSKINPASQSAVSNAVVNGAISSAKLTNVSDLNDRIRRAILFTSINYPENTAGAQDIIDTYGVYLTLDMSDYNKVNDKANLVSDLVNKGPFASIGTLSTELDKLAGDYLKAQNKPSSQGGGVTSKPSTPVITPAQGTGVTGTGALHTDDLKVETGKYFGDVENSHWAYESTKYLNEKGILKGMDNGNFEPDRSIKREEFAKILVLAFNLKAEGEDKAFTDVDTNEWYYEYVKIASQNGIINGIGDVVFGVSLELSRQDIAVMLARVLDKNDVSGEAFTDDAEISSYAKDAVYTLKNMGVLSGTGNGAFEPKRAVTRAECAKIVFELIKE